MFHHGLFAASALIPMVNVPCPVSHDAWLMQVASRAFCSVVSGTDATAMVSAITGSRSATFTTANRACRIVLASAVWSTESAVIISPDATTELELDDCAVVLEHPARSTAAAAEAANHAPEPPRIRENFDLMLSPLTGPKTGTLDRLRLECISNPDGIRSATGWHCMSLPLRVAGVFEGRYELPTSACEVLTRRMAKPRQAGSGSRQLSTAEGCVHVPP